MQGRQIHMLCMVHDSCSSARWGACVRLASATVASGQLHRACVWDMLSWFTSDAVYCVSGDARR